MFNLGLWDGESGDPLDNPFIRIFFAIFVFLFTTLGIPLDFGGAKPNDPPVTTPGMHMRAVLIDGKLNRYQIFVPHGYSEDRTWPLVIFLCGAGERGTDGIIQTKVGIGPHLQNNPGLYPCLVLLPQIPGNRTWDDSPEYVNVPLEEVKRLYSVDVNRISLTGMSMGGDSVWTYGAADPGRYSCLMPVAARPASASLDKLTGIPIMIHHGVNDLVYPVGNVRAAVDQLRNAGGTVIYREYPAAGHNVWDYAYPSSSSVAFLINDHQPPAEKTVTPSREPAAPPP
jgi:predicted peptidase